MEESKIFQAIYDLRGRVAFVTGSYGHLGKSIVKVLCEAGAHVILNGTSRKKSELLKKELIRSGYSVSTAVFDITDEMMLKAEISKIEGIERLDIVVNNAYSGKSGVVENSTLKSFHGAYNIAVASAFNIIKNTLPLLKESAKLTMGGASIINIASMYGTVSPDPAIYGDSGENSPPFYGAAKAGLIQLTRYLACHLAPYNIRVNSISPGPFPRQEAVNANPVFLNKLCEKVPMKRIGNPDEIKGPVLFLASDPAEKPSPNLELIMDFSLTLSVQLGKNSKNLKETRRIRPGAVMELDRFINEPVDVLINDRLIAQGEVVIVGEYFGVKIKHIINPIERVRKLG